MSSSRLIRRLLQGRGHSSALPSRIDVQPPAPWHAPDSVWRSVWNWLHHDKPSSPKSLRTLDLARDDFCSALEGLPFDDAMDLRQRGAHARSLRELWHLRADLYSVVARHRSQSEADRRLQAINRYFPRRASGNSPTSQDLRHG